jgi:hypothetical protein
MQLPVRESSALILPAIFLLLGTLCVARGENTEGAVVGQPSATTQSTDKEVETKAIEQPPVKTTEPWQITVDGPGWLAGVSGHTGFHGVNPYVFREQLKGSPDLVEPIPS